jgi:hypothetical protein
LSIRNLGSCYFIDFKTKMTEVSESGNTKNGVTQSSRSVNISIANIFAKVNPFIQKGTENGIFRFCAFCDA